MKLKDVVAEIPSTNVKDIIKFLKKNKAKGRRGSCWDCPIGVYIEKRGIPVTVSRLAICSKKATIPITPAMYHFMRLFDLGKIPSLEKPEE